VEKLRARPDIKENAAAMRAVGYRQLLAHLAGEYDLDEAVQRSIAASRQLAKRQLTWIRADADWRVWDPVDPKECERWLVEMSYTCQTAG
ncbi:MAG: tRNA (adenosine(37)-N6)-dimethylallyltransferase MiaA, partial [Gammaproteobacteria bacterium]|nr:tRNA (adenosine(37)-N6)-dimethylallyltransferase MiaA [Gammaproteobacteria bacterium]